MGVGLYFIAEAYDKTKAGWLRSGKPLERMMGFALRRAPGWYAHFIRGTVLPHSPVFARLVTVGEWAVGIALLLGLLTELGAAGAIFLNANYMFQSPLTGLFGSIDRLFILCALVFIVCSAGRTWGLDGVLWRRLPDLRQTVSRRSTRASPAD
jgi:thiosulfate dehydrogenase (quinone) large subunit